MNRAQRGAALLVVAVTVVLALTACSIGGPEVSSRATCDGPSFTSDTMPAAPARTLVLVDLADNGERAREQVVGTIAPIVFRAVVEGGIVRLVISGGEGQRLAVSPCLDGASPIMVDRNNEETERRAQNTAVEAIKGNLFALLEETEISPRGDLSNMLSAIPGELRSLSGTEGGRRDAPTSVVVVSDLTSPAAQGDCLYLDGIRTSRAVAVAMVRRCLEAAQFHPLPAAVTLRILRPQLVPGNNAGRRMGGYLMASLCAQMTKERGGCTSEPVWKG